MIVRISPTVNGPVSCGITHCEVDFAVGLPCVTSVMRPCPYSPRLHKLPLRQVDGWPCHYGGTGMRRGGSIIVTALCALALLAGCGGPPPGVDGDLVNNWPA